MHGNGGTLVWTICYFIVLLGMSLYGIHRYFIIFLYFRNRHRAPRPPLRFSELPMVTVQLPIYNEVYVIKRLLTAVSPIDYPGGKLEIQILYASTDEATEIAHRETVHLRNLGFQGELVRSL